MISVIPADCLNNGDVLSVCYAHDDITDCDVDAD